MIGTIFVVALTLAVGWVMMTLWRIKRFVWALGVLHIDVLSLVKKSPQDGFRDTVEIAYQQLRLLQRRAALAGALKVADESTGDLQRLIQDPASSASLREHTIDFRALPKDLHDDIIAYLRAVKILGIGR